MRRFSLVVLLWSLIGGSVVVCLGEACSDHGQSGMWPTDGYLQALNQFVVPFTNFPGTDLSKLDPVHRDMVVRLSAVPVEERPPVAACFAEDTDPEIVRAVCEILYGLGGPLDFQLNTRWSSTANGGTGTAPNPITLTYSFAPDGINIPDGIGEGAANNTLFATLNADFGSQALWQSKFAEVFARWEELTGIHYVLTTDDGAAWGTAGALGLRGDVRICSKPIDGGSNVLAYNFFPNSGDMVIDNAENWGSATNNYRFFRNTVSHEHGHGMGLSHVCPINTTKLLEPFLATNFDGPQHDDTRGGQRHYGDTDENNDTFGTATPLGNVSGTVTINDRSIDDDTDTDWYSFTVGASTAAAITLTPVGFSYLDGPQNGDGSCSAGSSINSIDDNNMGVELVSTNGTTVLASANSQPAGTAETIAATGLPGAGTYFVHVLAGAQNALQLYQLVLTVTTTGPFVNITAPNGGETWFTGTSQNITWTSGGISGNVRIELNRSYPAGAWESLFANSANDGTEAWSVTGATGPNCRVRVISISAPTVGDTSNANFTLSPPTISVTIPNGGETWFVGFTQPISWTSQAVTGNVRVELNRTYPAGPWESLFANTANDGTENWVVTGTTTSATCRMRVISISNPAVGDTSNTNFTISLPIITVLSPNGGENWFLNNSQTITWTTDNLFTNVNIELNRNFSGGTWETIVTNTVNDGSHSFTLTGAPSAGLARVRITSVSIPGSTDISDNNFTIASPFVTVTRANGGEILDGTVTENVTWLSGGITGNVNIELNRDYPAGSWNLIAVVPNTGLTTPVLGGPPTFNARFRITSVSTPSATDFSDNNFTINVPNLPPAIFHDPHQDAPSGNILFTARAVDDFNQVAAVRLHKRVAGIGSFDSTAMTPTGNPNQYSLTVNLADGKYEYFIRAYDAVNAVTTTQTYLLDVGACALPLLTFDDGTAEGFNYCVSDSFEWALKINPSSTPFLLCEAQIAIAARKPDSLHSSIRVRVLNANGPGGLPGTELWNEVSGSIGNVIGGLPVTPVNFASVLIKDGSGNPLALNGPFYVAVSNPVEGKVESFGHDDNGSPANSYFFDGCDQAWHNEGDAHPNAVGGTRMIRVRGQAQLNPPTQLTIRPSGNDLILNWQATGAPFYHIYSAASLSGPFTTLEGSSATNSFTDIGGAIGNSIRFYVVVSSTTP